MTQARRISLHAALLTGWMALAVGATWALDLSNDTVLATTVVIGLAGALPLIRPFRGSHLLVTFVGGTALGVVHGIRAVQPDGTLDPIDLLPGIAAVLSVIFTTYFASRLHSSITDAVIEDGNIQSYLQRIGPGAPGATIATRRDYMRRLVSAEVDRARRYEHAFSVLVVAPDRWHEHSRRMDPAQLARVSAELEHHLLARLRTTDTIMQLEDTRFIAMLPETNMEGAHVAARKLAIAAESVLGVEVRTGIASFPEDGITADQLLGEAEAALAFAESAGIALASRALLR